MAPFGEFRDLAPDGAGECRDLALDGASEFRDVTLDGADEQHDLALDGAEVRRKKVPDGVGGSCVMTLGGVLAFCRELSPNGASVSWEPTLVEVGRNWDGGVSGKGEGEDGERRDRVHMT